MRGRVAQSKPKAQRKAGWGPPPMLTLEVWRLGEVGYEAAWALQQRLHAARAAGLIPDQLLLLSHPHTLAVGTRSGKPDPWENLVAPREALEASGVALVLSDRGGPWPSGTAWRSTSPATTAPPTGPWGRPSWPRSSACSKTPSC